jgi:hypothetical protein
MSVIIAAVVFGCIGTVAFVYGWRRRHAKILAIGAVLCVYPYFTGDSVWLAWGIGMVLTGALFFLND